MPGVLVVRGAFLEVVGLVIAGTISLGDLSLLVNYFAQICIFSVYLGALWFTLQLSAPGLERVFFLMDLQPERDPPGARALPPVRESLCFEDVSFAHGDGSAALRGVSFEARRGQVTAVVGPAGAGKTTLVSHVPRFLEPKSGRVLVDGQDLAGVTRDSLRAQIGFVFQENALFAGTLEDNLRLAQAGRDGVRAAPRRAARRRRRVRAGAARGLAHPARPRRRGAVGRPEAAHRDRSRAAPRRAAS